MPSVARSKNWYIRITAPWDHLKAKVKDVKSWVDYQGLFAGYHIGEKTDKPHVHIALKLSSELQKQSIDKRMKELFDVKGSDYSAKPWDGEDDALAYMFHDSQAQIDNSIGKTKEEIEKLQLRNKDVQKMVALAKEKASCKVVDHVLAKIRASGNMWSLHDIAYEIWKGVHAGLFYHPGTQFKRYVEEIYCKQCANEEELGLTFEEIFGRMYPEKKSW